MNADRMTEFFKKLSNDAALRDDFVAFAGKHGFDFNELSDEELEAVAGGRIRLPLKIRR